MCYLLQNSANLLFPLQIRWSSFFQWWITESDHITCSQVAGANQLHISSPLPPATAVCLSENCSQGLHRNQAGGRLNALFPLIESISLTQQWLLCASLPEGGVCVWPLKLVHGHSFIPQQWYEISLCYNSILIKWCYHSNKICCCPFIPFQSICVYSPFCNHWTWVSSGKKSVRTKIRKDYTPATN